jgi:hypothetical protein
MEILSVVTLQSNIPHFVQTESTLLSHSLSMQFLQRKSVPITSSINYYRHLKIIRQTFGKA